MAGETVEPGDETFAVVTGAPASGDGGWPLIVVEAKDLDEAVDFASLIPAAQHGTIEVRPVWEM